MRRFFGREGGHGCFLTRTKDLATEPRSRCDARQDSKLHRRRLHVQSGELLTSRGRRTCVCLSVCLWIDPCTPEAIPPPVFIVGCWERRHFSGAQDAWRDWSAVFRGCAMATQTDDGGSESNDPDPQHHGLGRRRSGSVGAG